MEKRAREREKTKERQYKKREVKESAGDTLVSNAYKYQPQTQHTNNSYQAIMISRT